MATKEISAVIRRLKYAILADNHHHLKKLCEKRDILPMYLFLKTAYKAEAQQKPDAFLKECRKLNRMLLLYQTENTQYQTLESLSSSKQTSTISINNEQLIRHFSHALNQHQYQGQRPENTLFHLKQVIRRLIEDVSMSTYQHLTTGRFAEHFNRLVGQATSCSTTHFKQQLSSSAPSLATTSSVPGQPHTK